MTLLAARLLLAVTAKALNPARVAYGIPLTMRRRALSLSRLYSKYFPRLENDFAYSVLRAREELQSKLMSINPEQSSVSSFEFESFVNSDWSQASPEIVAKTFDTVSFYATEQSLSVSDSVFDGICDAVISKCKDMRDDDLFLILRALVRWGPSAESSSAKNFIMWKELDLECCNRVKHWNRKTLLYAADHWYNLGVGRLSNFMNLCNGKVARKVSALNPDELLQALFYLNVSRKHPCLSEMCDYEYCFQKNIDKMNIDEIAVLALAFFKTRSKLHNETLLSNIIDRTIESASTVNSVSLSAILKIVRYSMKLTAGDRLYALLDALQKEIPRLKLLCCIQMAMVGTNVQVLHEGVLKAVCERATNEICQLRLKDLERLAMTIVLLNYDPKTTPCIYERIVEEVRNPERAEEIKKYPQSLSRTLYFLSQRNIYLPELIAQVLDPNFLKETFGKDRYMVGVEIVGLDVGVALECPTYSGPRLEEKTKITVSKKYKVFMPENVRNTAPIGVRMMRDIFDASVTATGNSNRVCVCHLLPHYPRPALVLRLGPAGKPLEIPEKFLQFPVGCEVRPVGGAPGDRWCAVHIGTPNSYVRDSDRPTGLSVVCHRQCVLLGYEVSVVPWFDWIRLSPDGHTTYMKNFFKALAEPQ